MVARLACDRPLIGVWPTIPSEVRFDSGDTGLGDRLLNALFAATLAKLGLFERVHTLWNDGSHAALFGYVRRAQSACAKAWSRLEYQCRPIPGADHEAHPVSSRAASRVAQSIRRVEAATSAKHSREQRLL